MKVRAIPFCRFDILPFCYSVAYPTIAKWQNGMMEWPFSVSERRASMELNHCIYIEQCKSKATVNGAAFQQASACSKTCTPKKEERILIKKPDYCNCHTSRIQICHYEFSHLLGLGHLNRNNRSLHLMA